jgi:hypothetical protein
MINFNG